jgi:hypothetical protein
MMSQGVAKGWPDAFGPAGPGGTDQHAARLNLGEAVRLATTNPGRFVG